VGFTIVVALAALALVTAGLLWSVRKMKPYADLESELATLKLEVDTLGNQFTKFRTRKAGKASAAQREEDEDDPLRGLTPEQKALFNSYEQ
jgi:hypothetical protein